MEEPTALIYLPEAYGDSSGHVSGEYFDLPLFQEGKTLNGVVPSTPFFAPSRTFSMRHFRTNLVDAGNKNPTDTVDVILFDISVVTC